jgi:hypothetical protein
MPGPVCPSNRPEDQLPQKHSRSNVCSRGCPSVSPGIFPSNQLGIATLNTKLKLSAFAPLIAKVDKYLAGWKATLLSPAGRVVLINAVLDGLPTYAMVALFLPGGSQGGFGC